MVSRERERLVICDLCLDAASGAPRCSECGEPVLVPPVLPVRYRLVCGDCAHSW